MAEAKEYPIFRRMDPNVIPGMSLKSILLVLAAGLAGVLVFFALGAITMPVEVETPYQQTMELEARYAEMQNCIVYEEAAADKDNPSSQAMARSIRDYALSNRTTAEIAELAKEGRELGLTATTQPSEIAAMVPGTVMEEQPVLSGLVRGIVGILPALLMGAWRFCRNGISISLEVKNLIEYNKSQKLYEYRKAE